MLPGGQTMTILATAILAFLTGVSISFKTGYVIGKMGGIAVGTLKTLLILRGRQ
jgi:hypothetical protein